MTHETKDLLQEYLSSLYHEKITSRVHNKRRERECLTLTMLCTNALRIVRSVVSYRILLFYINTYW